MTQLALTFPDLITPEYEPEMTLADRFAAFHASNPHVADALEHLAAQWLARHERVGMKALFERLRWESGIRTEGSAYVLNNSWTAFYSRLLLDRRPEWAGRITTRRALADGSA
jgi:hypothetical protein